VDFFLLREIPFFFRALMLFTSEFFTPNLFLALLFLVAVFFRVAFAIVSEVIHNWHALILFVE
jgi:hypothetical protein